MLDDAMNKRWDSYGYVFPDSFTTMAAQKKWKYDKPISVSPKLTEIESFFTQTLQDTVDLVEVIIDDKPSINPGPEPENPYEKMYLTFEVLSDTIFSFSENAKYSIDDGETWSDVYGGEEIPVAAGEKIMWKRNYLDSSDRGNFAQYTEYSGVNQYFNVYGNIMSMSYGDDFIGKTEFPEDSYGFGGMFKEMQVVSAENLILPATALTDSCYSHMFQACYSLTTAPELPATILAPNCYSGMFSSCESINYVKCLATTNISSQSTCNNWLYGVSSEGTFVKAQDVDWERGSSGIPENWNVEEE